MVIIINPKDKVHPFGLDLTEVKHLLKFTNFYSEPPLPSSSVSSVLDSVLSLGQETLRGPRSKDERSNGHDNQGSFRTSVWTCSSLPLLLLQSRRFEKRRVSLSQGGRVRQTYIRQFVLVATPFLPPLHSSVAWSVSSTINSIQNLLFCHCYRLGVLALVGSLFSLHSLRFGTGPVLCK